MLKILLLGSTGSIGSSTVNCVRRYPEQFTLVGLSANSNVDKLLAQTREFSVRSICLGSAQAAERARCGLDARVDTYVGDEGLAQIVNQCDFDILVNALVGAVGLAPTVCALQRGKRVALANKESLVVGGDLITSLVDAGRGQILPVDSEHSAILQALGAEKRSAIESLILTASGGPFRLFPAEKFDSITPTDALNHPTWLMGNKITIDCATLMNKGFEVIEAHHLFRVPYERIRVCIHPQSIIHSMVEFHDGAVLAQMGLPDMELPIQYALSYPERLALPGKRLDLASIGSLTFLEPDHGRFPCLKLCIEAGRAGGTAPVVANAANEVAVQMFLENRIPFTAIASILEEAMQRHRVTAADSLEAIQEADARTRNQVSNAWRD